MTNHCARCGQKVKGEENRMRAHLWASNAVFHWVCFIALMKEHGEQGAEQAASRGSRGTTGTEDPKHSNRN
jgi:hypothetical protein